MPTAVMPGIVGGRKPQSFANRSACSSSTGKPRPYAAGCAPISEPPWTPLWPRIGMRPHFSRPTIPRASPRFTIALTLSTPNRWWVMPMLQTKIADLASWYIRAKSSIRSVETPACCSSCSQVCDTTSTHRIETRRVLLDEVLVDPAVLDQVLQHAVDEADVPTRVDREELVREARPEEGAARNGRHPVPLEPGLPHRIHDRDPGALLLRVVQ